MSGRIYDPKSPNLYGYRLYRPDPTFAQFISSKLRKWICELIWLIYGRDKIVAVYLHRNQTVLGKLKNWMAAELLDYIFGDET